VNPNVATLTGFMCHEDHDVAMMRGQEGAQFFAFGLGHYWRDGTHFPGRTNLWSDFQKRPLSVDQKIERQRKKAGMGGIGSPRQLIENFRALETVGVDQLILLHQCGDYKHEHICSSLELFAAEVLPEFKEREAARAKSRQEELAPFIEEANRKARAPEDMPDVAPVEAYPIMWKKLSSETPQNTPDRRPGMTAFWQAQVGGKRRKK
jgi:hypothetical protein